MVTAATATYRARITFGPVSNGASSSGREQRTENREDKEPLLPCPLFSVLCSLIAERLVTPETGGGQLAKRLHRGPLGVLVLQRLGQVHRPLPQLLQVGRELLRP